MSQVDLANQPDIRNLTSSGYCPAFEPYMVEYLEREPRNPVACHILIGQGRNPNVTYQTIIVIADVYFKKPAASRSFQTYGVPSGLLTIRIGDRFYGFVVEKPGDNFNPLTTVLKVRRPAYMPTAWFWGDYSDSLQGNYTDQEKEAIVDQLFVDTFGPNLAVEQKAAYNEFQRGYRIDNLGAKQPVVFNNYSIKRHEDQINLDVTLEGVYRQLLAANNRDGGNLGVDIGSLLQDIRLDNERGISHTPKYMIQMAETISAACSAKGRFNVKLASNIILQIFGVGKSNEMVLENSPLATIGEMIMNRIPQSSFEQVIEGILGSVVLTSQPELQRIFLRFAERNKVMFMERIEFIAELASKNTTMENGLIFKEIIAHVDSEILAGGAAAKSGSAYKIISLLADSNISLIKGQCLKELSKLGKTAKKRGLGELASLIETVKNFHD